VLRAEPEKLPRGVRFIQHDAGGFHLQHLPGGIVDDSFDPFQDSIGMPTPLDHVVIKPQPVVPAPPIQGDGNLVFPEDLDAVSRDHVERRSRGPRHGAG